jgi:acetyl-CoA synthetase
LIEQGSLSEAAVVGVNDDLTGQAVIAFVALKDETSHLHRDVVASEDALNLRKALIMQVRTEIGPFAAPKHIVIVGDLPKTRSGKIMRRILRKVSAGEADQLGDITTLANPQSVADIIEAVEHQYFGKK